MKVSRKLGRKSLGNIGAKSKSVLLAGIFALGGGLILPLSAEAAEAEVTTTTKAEDSSASETPAYTMGEVVVTATRTEKREVDVPMATEVITEEDIKESGAKNAAEALQKVNGFEYGAFGPIGSAMGTMTNEANIRGIDNGTLVLVNGVPIAHGGKYNLQEIPADAIEKIEVVKGGGSVLYGSEAMAGVVNIITKTEAANSVTVGFGNYGQQKYHLNVGGEGLMITYDRNRFGWQDEATINTAANGSTKTKVRNTMNQSATISYRANDHLSFLYGHYETRALYERWVRWSTRAGVNPGDPFNNRYYTTLRDMFQVNYHDKNWKGSLYYNSGTIDSHGDTYLRSTYQPAVPWAPNGNPANFEWYNTRQRNITYGLDVQRNWTLGKGKLTAGLAAQHEIFHSLPAYTMNGYAAAGSDTVTYTVRNYSRNNWGVFAQWDQKIDDKNEFILGGRETWTTGAVGGLNYNNFSLSGQFLHKMTDKDNLFLNISQSFIMPTLSQMYTKNNLDGSSDGLKPQKGINYEIGWKRKDGNHTWKASLFMMRITDNISANWDAARTLYTYENEKFHNEGLELSYSMKAKKGFSYNAGLTWQNPKRKVEGSNQWDRKFGKIQVTAGVNYKMDKWHASFQGSFLGARVGTRSNNTSIARKPYFLTSLTIGYEPTDKSEFDLTVNNLFNRHDVISHSSSEYFVTPCNFLFSFTQKF